MQLREFVRPAAVVTRLTPIVDVARLMAESGKRAVVVVDHDELWGIVTDRDLVVRGLARNLPTGLPVSWVASPNPVWADAGDSVVAGYARLRESGFRQLPVIADGACVGLLRLDDLLGTVPVEEPAHQTVTS